MRKSNFSDVAIVPRKTTINTRKEINIVQNIKGLVTNGVIVANMDTTGTFSMARKICPEGFCVALHKYYSPQQLIDFYTKEKYDVLDRTFITIGSGLKELNNLLSLGIRPKNICMDVANGYMESFHESIKVTRQYFPKSFILAGNVCTPEGCEAILNVGADAVKIGLASGGVCSTKSTTGIYYPQFSAIQDSALACSRLGGIICSDGGIKEVGDICKAMGVGANLVMCGSLFSGYDECEAQWNTDKDGDYMLFYGMSSKTANHKYNGGLKQYRAAEGIEKKIYRKGNIEELLQEIKGGLASCCSYTNFKNLQDSVGKQTFIYI